MFSLGILTPVEQTFSKTFKQISSLISVANTEKPNLFRRGMFLPSPHAESRHLRLENALFQPSLPSRKFFFLRNCQVKVSKDIHWVA